LKVIFELKDLGSLVGKEVKFKSSLSGLLTPDTKPSYIRADSQKVKVENQVRNPDFPGAPLLSWSMCWLLNTLTAWSEGHSQRHQLCSVSQEEGLLQATAER